MTPPSNSDSHSGALNSEQEKAWSPTMATVPRNLQQEYRPLQLSDQTLSEQEHQQQQQQPDLSLLYASSFGPPQPVRQSPLPLQTSANSGQSSASRSHSFPPASGLSSSDSSSLLSPSPKTILSTGALPNCICSMLGQSVCTCAKQWTRPRIQIHNSSSSTTLEMADSNRSHSSSIISPVHLSRPLYPKMNNISDSTSIRPTSWLPAYNEEVNRTASMYPHPVNTQLPSQLSTMQHIPLESPASSSTSSSSSQISHNAQHPEMTTYLYDAIPPTNFRVSPSQYNPSSGVDKPSDERNTTIVNPSKQLESSAMIVPDEQASTSHSGYRSAESSSSSSSTLSHWLSRQSMDTELSYQSMGHSNSQLPSRPINGRQFDVYSMNRPSMLPTSDTDLSQFNSYEQQSRAMIFPSMSTYSSSTNKLDILQGHDPVNVGSSSSSSTTRFATDEDRWNAIANRTHAADAYFLFGSLNTRIYCRPSCASNRPDRTRIIFFPFPNAANQAEGSGYRPCKRCKPRILGTADACVLAVGQCLRHITQAAISTNSADEVDSRLKKRTLKEYSLEYGVSAFHFHRTLKNVSTLTPGDYSKACHALVLQDEIGLDRYDGQIMTNEELQKRLRGWTNRRARKAVGNIAPSVYARGFPNMNMYYIYAPDTRFGKVCILYSRVKGGGGTNGEITTDAVDSNDDEIANHHCTIMAALIGEDSLIRIQKRAPQAIAVPSQSSWLHSLVQDLDQKGLREIQMPQEVIPWVRRARIWLAVKDYYEGVENPSNWQEVQEE